MLVADVLADPAKDDVTIYELPGLNEPESVVLPVVHGYWNQRPQYYYNVPRFEEFGIPFYVVLTKDEKTDYDRIYEKIRRKYAQFSSADELHAPIPAPAEDSSDDVMEEVVLTRQDVNQNLVTIRVQPYQKPTFLFQRSAEVEMPTTVEKPNNLYDLRDYLRPPVRRMQSLAPSAMESVHQGTTPPESDHGDTSNEHSTEDTVYLTNHRTYMNQSDPQDAIDSTLTDEEFQGDLRFSDSDLVDETNFVERATPPMLDSDEDNIPPSQIGRAGAPSPATQDVLPTYDSLYPDPPSQDEATSTDAHDVKFGDGLICEWSDPAYQHVFNNYKYHTFWETHETWIDPNPPPEEPEKKNIDLDDCLNEFGREEELGQEDLWYCPRCKEHRQARKTLQLWRVPDIFAVHLKRFSANRGFRDKLDNMIDFPLTGLDLTDRVGDKTWIEEERGGERLVYDLFAVDNHYGGLSGGHYTAYAQNYIDGKWYYFDGNLLLYEG